MNKLYLLLLISFFIATSCRSDSEDKSTNSNPTIVGTWKLVKEEIYSGKNPTVLLETQFPDTCEKTGYETFTSDLKYQAKFYYQSGNACLLLNNVNTTYTFNTSSKILMITGDSQSSEVISLTSTTKEEKSPNNEDINNDGFDEIAIGYYVRQ